MTSHRIDNAPPSAAVAAGPHHLHVFPSFGTGGRELRAVELIRLQGAGVRHTILALNGETDAFELLRDDVDRGALDVRVVPNPVTGRPWSRLVAMRRFLRGAAADLVLTYNWGAIEWVLAARLQRLPFVHHEDGFGAEEAGVQIRRRVLARRWLLGAARAVIVPSASLAALARDVWRLPAERVLHLKNGVELGRFRAADGPRAAGDVVFGCVGRVRPEKHQAHAVEAFAAATCRDHARLRIVGDGPSLAAVRGLAAELGVADRVDFVGGVSDPAPEYRRMDVFVIPSRTEQLPLALLEAMASGLPVVSTAVGDVPNVVDPSNRDWIVPVDDVAALAAAMDRAAIDPAARAARGAANRARVEREYEREVCYRRYVEVYAAARREPKRT